MSNSTENIILRSYNRVWRIERVIYRLEKIRLPFPVSFRQIGFFLIAWFLMKKLSGIEWIAQQSFVLRLILIPGAFAWFMTKYQFDGKPPHLFFWSLITYYFEPHKLARYRPVNKMPARFIYKDVLAFRGRQLKEEGGE